MCCVVVKINFWQQRRISSLVIRNLFGNLSHKKIAILGFSFKANTNDTRESPSINISRDLLQEGAILDFYDPKVNESQIFKEFNEIIDDENVLVSKTALQAVNGADAVLVLTDWDEFRSLEWGDMFKAMRKPAWVFDTRICLDKKNLKEIGFNVWSLGS